MRVRSYRDLQVWQKAMDLVTTCYQITQNFPSNEIYGLTSQMRRAAVSVAANLAEGHSRAHRREFLQHVGIAYGSLAEVETHLMIAKNIGYLSNDQAEGFLSKTTEIGRMLNGLRNALKSKEIARSQPLTPDPRPPTPDP